MSRPRNNLEEILLRHFWASEQDIKQARRCRKPGQSLVDALIETGSVSSRHLARALARLYRLPFQAEVDEGAIDKALLTRISIKYAQRNRILPFGIDGTSLIVAIADPSNYHAPDDLGVLFCLPVHSIVVPFDLLDHLIARSYDAVFNDRITLTAQGPITVLDEQELEAVSGEFFQQPFDEILEEDPRLIRLVNALFRRAINEHAGQILIEPGEQNLLVRFRAEAAPYNVMSAPKCLATAFVSRIKAMAGLKMTEGRNPLEGDIRLRIAGRIMCARLSLYSESCGEQVIVRLDRRPQQHLLGVIDDFADAVCGLATNVNAVLKPLACSQCGASIVVAAAVFCKNCGARVRNTSGSAKTAFALVTTSPRC